MNHFSAFSFSHQLKVYQCVLPMTSSLSAYTHSVSYLCDHTSDRGDKEKAEADKHSLARLSSQGHRQRHNKQPSKIIAVIMRRPKRTAGGWRWHHLIYASEFVCYLTEQSLHVWAKMSERTFIIILLLLFRWFVWDFKKLILVHP